MTAAEIDDKKRLRVTSPCVFVVVVAVVIVFMQLTFMGKIIVATEEETVLRFTVDDGTGRAPVSMWKDSDDPESLEKMKEEWKDRILKLKGEWRIKKRKRFWKKVLNWFLMILLIGGAIYVYITWMK